MLWVVPSKVLMSAESPADSSSNETVLNLLPDVFMWCGFPNKKGLKISDETIEPIAIFFKNDLVFFMLFLLEVR